MSRNKETPELFEIKINNIKKSFIFDVENKNDSNFKNYFQDLSDMKKKIQNQITILVDNKPSSAEKVFSDLKDIYFMSYMNNFALFVGLVFVCRYLFLYTSTSEMNKTSSSLPVSNN